MRSVIRWWYWLPAPWLNWRVVGSVAAGDELPERLPRKGAVLVGPVERPTWIAFDCPCPERHRLMINLDRTRRPAWRIRSLHPLTIFPSIDDNTPRRRCHFFLTRGKITWVATSKGEFNGR